MSLSVRQTAKSSFVNRVLCVLRAWWKRPAEVASICPSSPILTSKVADRDCIRQARSVVELGPGAGGTTVAILKQMRTDSRLLAIEKTLAFAETLDEITDLRFTSVIGDAVDLVSILEKHRLQSPDVIVSGIPFSALSSDVAQEIMQSIYRALAPGGTFIAYQVRSDVEQYAQPLFGRANCELVALNLPPLKVFAWQKTDSPTDESRNG